MFVAAAGLNGLVCEMYSDVSLQDLVIGPLKETKFKMFKVCLHQIRQSRTVRTRSCGASKQRQGGLWSDTQQLPRGLGLMNLFAVLGNLGQSKTQWNEVFSIVAKQSKTQPISLPLPRPEFDPFVK